MKPPQDEEMLDRLSQPMPESPVDPNDILAGKKKAGFRHLIHPVNPELDVELEKLRY